MNRKFVLTGAVGVLVIAGAVFLFKSVVSELAYKLFRRRTVFRHIKISICHCHVKLYARILVLPGRTGDGGRCRYTGFGYH